MCGGSMMIVSSSPGAIRQVRSFDATMTRCDCDPLNIFLFFYRLAFSCSRCCKCVDKTSYCCSKSSRCICRCVTCQSQCCAKNPSRSTSQDSLVDLANPQSSPQVAVRRSVSQEHVKMVSSPPYPPSPPPAREAAVARPSAKGSGNAPLPSAPLTPLGESCFEHLKAAFPASDALFLRRFATAAKSPSAASASVTAYLQWRLSTFPLCANPLGEFLPSSPPSFPRNWLQRGGVCKGGNPVVFSTGCAYICSIPAEVYVKRCCHLFDETFPDDGVEGKVSLFIDVRPMEGMPNEPGLAFLPFFKLLCATLIKYYPERIHIILLYPMPWIATVALNTIKGALDKDIASKILVMSGGQGLQAPKKLLEYIDADQLPNDELVKTYHSEFN